jgi:hypothetical protein
VPGNGLPDWVTTLQEAANDHLAWCREHQHELGYPPDRLTVHTAMVSEYFGPPVQ